MSALLQRRAVYAWEQRQPHRRGLDIFNLLLVNHKPRGQLDPNLGVVDPVVLARLAMDAFTCQIKHIESIEAAQRRKDRAGGLKPPCVVGGESVGKVEGDLRSQSWVSRVAVLRLGATLGATDRRAGRWVESSGGRATGRTSVAAGLPSHASRASRALQIVASLHNDQR